MKIKFLALFCSIFICITQSTYSDCRGCNQHETAITAPIQKTYLQPDQIAFHNSKIYVQLEEGIFTVPAVFSDQHGLYIPNEKQPRGRCEPYEWKCPNPRCDKCNDFYNHRCPSCGTEME